MKALRTLLSVAVLGMMIAFAGCGGGSGNSEPLWDKQLGLLTKTWVVKSSSGVLFGSGVSQVDSTDNWLNNPQAFTLKITGTKGGGAAATYNFECTNRPPRSVWPLNGTWQFGSNPSNSIVRSDGAQITYSVDPSSSNLQLIFTFSGSGYTRVGSVSGDWEFNLVPQ